jgi:hypothetical protein
VSAGGLEPPHSGLEPHHLLIGRPLCFGVDALKVNPSSTYEL